MSTTLEVDVRKTNPAETWTPIPLSPFEAMMVTDDRPGSSMTCSAEFYFDGEIQQQPFQQAIETALQRHRLLRAVVRGKGKQLSWHPANHFQSIYWNQAEVSRHQDALPQLDLKRFPGHRCWVNVTPVSTAPNGEGSSGFRSIMRFEFHHACCDAIGGMGFIEDAFTIYDAIIHNKPARLRPIDEKRLKRRGHVSFPAKWSTKILRTLLDVQRSTRLLTSKPIPVPTLLECKPWKSRFIVRHLPEEDLVGLRYAASHASATLNDFLLVEFLCLLRDWVEAEPKSTRARRDHIRVITPMNLRDREDLKLEAANKIGFSFLSRSFRQLRSADTTDWKSFISQVNAEIEQAKRFRLPACFLKKLAIARVSQRWFESFFSESRCWGTAVLTQLGDPTRRFYNRFPRKNGRILLGNLVLTDFVSCGPLRPLTHAILSTNAYGNELTLSMRCNPTKVARETAETFLDDFVDRLQRRGDMHRRSRD